MEADETKNLRISVAPVNGLRFEDKPFGYLFFVGVFSSCLTKPAVIRGFPGTHYHLTVWPLS